MSDETKDPKETTEAPSQPEPPEPKPASVAAEDAVKPPETTLADETKSEPATHTEVEPAAAQTEAPTKSTSAPPAESPAEAKAEPAAKPEAPATAEAPPVAAKPTPPPRPPAPPRATPAAPPAAGGHKPAPPAKKGPVVTVEITDDALINKIKDKFGDAITETVATYGQKIVRVKKDGYHELCRFLREDEDGAFDMLTDLTITHHPDKAGEAFDVVAFLYSTSGNQRLRVKTAIGEGEEAASVTDIWEGANWMEREAYDMFGVKFNGHPDLRRILLPEDWPGFPLRKEYPIEYRDNEWTDKHLDYREVDYDTSLINVRYAERR